MRCYAPRWPAHRDMRYRVLCMSYHLCYVRAAEWKIVRAANSLVNPHTVLC